MRNSFKDTVSLRKFVQQRLATGYSEKFYRLNPLADPLITVSERDRTTDVRYL